MSYLAFIILNFIVYVRPSEIFEAVYGAPMYNITVLVCMILTAPALIAQMNPSLIAKRPITFCVLAILASSPLGHLAAGDIDLAIDSVYQFFLTALYFLLLMGTVTTKERLRGLMFWVTIFIGVLTVIVLLNLHGVIEMPTLNTVSEWDVDKTTGERISLVRLQAVGIFNNPNAYARILIVAILLSLYWLSDPKMRMVAPFWLGMVALFFYAQLETRSRGAFLGLIAGMMVLFVAKYGIKKAIPIGIVMLPVMLVLGGGRSTDISTTEGTAAHRIELWNLGFEAMLSKSKLSPIFGIGMNTYQEYTHGYVAHNSFVHIFVEYGFLGGAFYVGLFYLLVSGFLEVGKHESLIDDPEMRRLRTFLLSVFAAEMVGMMSIARCYVISTYTFVGMGAVYLELCSKIPGMPSRRVEGKTILRIFQAGAIVFACIYIYVKIKMRSIG